MDDTSLKSYYNKPCKFKLRSRKDVYGVVWKDGSEYSKNYYFSSSEDYNVITERGVESESLRTPVNLDDILAVEALQGIIPGKDMFK